MTGPSALPDQAGQRGSRLLGPSSTGRGVAMSAVSAVLFFGVVGWLLVNSPNWEVFRQAL